jgi:transglutaminase-like putative cysteine protease
MVQKHTGDPRLVEVASRIIAELNIPERNPVALARGFQKYVQENIKFFRESPERFVSPLRTLQWGIGDCDDKTIVLATLLRTFRLPVRLKFIRFVSAKTKKRVSHVYPQVGIEGKWITLETVQKWPIGKDAETILHKKNIPVKVEFQGDKL